MTAPTSPGVVPADDAERQAFERAYCAASPYRIKPAAVFNMREGDRYITSRISSAWHGWQLARADRPSLTEDEREQVRREAAQGERDRLFALLQDHSHNVGPYPIGLMVRDDPDLSSRWLARRRALADRSEPRQEKEGDRG